MNKSIIACSKKWFLKHQKKNVSKKYFIIQNKKNLNFRKLKKLNPPFIFFPHWSYYIPERIYNNFNCVIFHTSHLPYGRGGSPIQNLIMKNFKVTQICALEARKDLDSGKIYCREKISLKGDLDEIFFNISKKILKMIKKISNNKYNLTKQKGKKHTFKRLKKIDSKISKLNKIEDIYNKIRSVDDDEYPRAYIQFKCFKVEFSKAKFLNGKLICQSTIKKEYS